MDTRQLIDAQFDRAVEIVQGLPKNGPIQTGYEEKLTMYSLYKQATVGNVTSARPGIFDMLGRAKWDEWAKRRDLDSYEAKWLYVDALKKVLRKYSEKTIARDLLNDLDSYAGDPANLVYSRTMSKSPSSTSSQSRSSGEPVSLTQFIQSQQEHPAPGETDVPVNDESADQARDLPGPVLPHPRPQSSISSHRYRTPMASMMATSPPPPPTTTAVPLAQPLPPFETPSAFAEAETPTSPFPTTSSFVGQYSELSGVEARGSPNVYPAHPRYSISSQMQAYGTSSTRPASVPSLERAIENVQAHLAAVSERLESLESLSGQAPRSRLLPAQSGVPAIWAGAGGSGGKRMPGDRAGPESREWDFDDLGMWSLVVNPAVRGMAALRRAAAFIARNENRSPTMTVVRRLFLDISFLICVLAVVRSIWKKSGVRRREVRAALIVLGRAILGSKKERNMVDRGV